jgi:hypothetical protein
MTRLVTRAWVPLVLVIVVAPRRKGAGDRLLADLWRVLAGWPERVTPAPVLPAVLPRARPHIP